MRNARALVATDPRRFGRAPPWQLALDEEPASRLSGEAQLFAATFAAGFIFVSILIG